MNHMDKIENLTLHEKASMLSGYRNMETRPIDRLSIPSLLLSDGPNGLRIENAKGNSMDGIANCLPSTCFPSGVNMASSWDTSLIHEIGNAIGEESLHYGVNIVLGPAINIKRNPLCGRNFEYFSEDPFLAGKMAIDYVLGVQKNHVGCCLKHFACNNNEKYRFVGDSILDERALHEIYLKPFEMAVKEAKPYAVMSSYNMVNHIHSSENGYLQNTLLREKWGFDGITMTDWGGIVSRENGLLGGTDLEMPGQVSHSIHLLEEAVKEKRIPESLLDQSVERILTAIDRTENKKKETDFQKHYNLAVRAAEESAVLLRNERDILPLDKKKKFIVIGDFFSYIRYQGSGSALLNPYCLFSHKDIFEKNAIDYEYHQGFKEEEISPNKKLEDEVLSSIKDKDETILFFGGLNDYVESEGFDRDNLRMPENQISLLEKILEMKKKVVLILHNGSLIAEKILDQVDALLDLLLPGEGGAEACLHLLFGDVSPSGRLAETWVKEYEDVPFGDTFTKTSQEIYKESIFVGYRYYLSKTDAIRYPFGYGLSYSSFEYSNLKTEKTNEGYLFTFTITNTGKRDSYEVAQLYVAHPSKLMHPIKELKGFDKIYLKAKESKVVSIRVKEEDLKIYDVRKKEFVLEEGEYTFMISKNALEDQLSAHFFIHGEKVENPYSEKVMSHYLHLENLTSLRDEDYEELLSLPIPKIVKEKKITFETPIGEFTTPFGKLFRRITHKAARHSYKKACRIKDRLERERKKKAALFVMRMIPNNSLRSLCYSSSGVLKYPVAKGLLEMCNHHYIRGIKEMCKKEK